MASARQNAIYFASRSHNFEGIVSNQSSIPQFVHYFESETICLVVVQYK